MEGTRPRSPDWRYSGQTSPVDLFSVDHVPAARPMPGVRPAVAWWRRRFELLVTAGTLGMVLVLIMAVVLFQGRPIEFKLPDADPLLPIGPQSAWLDPRYAAGAGPAWQTDDQVLAVAPNREIIVSQVWSEDLVPGLAGLDLRTGEQLWRTDRLDCMSQGFLAGRAFCLADGSAQVVEVNLDDGSTAPVLTWPTPIQRVDLVGMTEQLRYLKLDADSSAELVAIDTAGQPVWVSEYPDNGSCELLIDRIACRDTSYAGLHVFDAASGRLELANPADVGPVEFASDGYLHHTEQGMSAVGFDGTQIDGLSHYFNDGYPAAPQCVHFPLAAFGSRPYPVVRDANGLIRLELVDGAWRLPGAAEPLPGLASPEAISADGALLLLFGSDQTGNYLRLADQNGEVIDQLTDLPAALYDGIVVIDFVVYPPAG